MKRTISSAFLLLLAPGIFLVPPHLIANSAESAPLTETGKIEVSGRVANYVIRFLPPNSFPDLPAPVASAIEASGCLIPQTYAAHQPENVVHASLELAGSEDWALLCANKGTVALMVFFASAPERPIVLASAPATERLQRHGGSPVLGFNWAIDPASPAQVHEAQVGLDRRPPRPDHDALADSVVDGKTIYHFYSKGKWTLVDLPD